MTTPISITIDVTAAPYSADNTGVSNATQAFSNVSQCRAVQSYSCQGNPSNRCWSAWHLLWADKSVPPKAIRVIAYLGEDIITLSGLAVIPCQV